MGGGKEACATFFVKLEEMSFGVYLRQFLGIKRSRYLEKIDIRPCNKVNQGT